MNHVVLIGFMGSGKTRVGKRLSKDLGLPFTDLEKMIISKTNLSMREVFERFGEPFYRAVFRAYFVEERDIGDPAVLTELAEGCGLPGEDFRTALETGAYAETVRRESCLSREALGIRMVPTILAGDKRLEGFVPDLDALRAWLDEVRRGA